MILLIDNYDSFTYNLMHRIGEVGNSDIKIIRNDELSASAALALKPNAIVLSPGPCTPDEAGICLKLCQQAHIPILGICLGHQSLAQAFGGKVIRASRQMHGKISHINHQGRGLFRGLETPISATRYHSLTVEAETLPSCFNIDARSADDHLIMAISHKTMPFYGLQFHPESISSPDGFAILRNFLEMHQLRLAS